MLLWWQRRRVMKKKPKKKPVAEIESINVETLHMLRVETAS